jgi:hypothetical protein
VLATQYQRLLPYDPPALYASDRSCAADTPSLPLSRRTPHLGRVDSWGRTTDAPSPAISLQVADFGSGDSWGRVTERPPLTTATPSGDSICASEPSTLHPLLPPRTAHPSRCFRQNSHRRRVWFCHGFRGEIDVGRERRGDRGVGKSSSDEPENGRVNG